MSMKRIVNQTPRTLIIPYGESGKRVVRLTRFAVSNPLPDNHPVFMETAMGGMTNNGHILVLTDGEYKQSADVIRAKLRERAAGAVQLRTDLNAHSRAVKAAEEHNRMVDLANKAKKIMSENISGDATSETLVPTPKLEKVEIPKAAPSIKREETRVEDLPVATQPTDQDTELRDLAEAVDAVEKATGNTASTKKRRNRKKKSQKTTTVEDSESTASDE